VWVRSSWSSDSRSGSTMAPRRRRQNREFPLRAEKSDSTPLVIRRLCAIHRFQATRAHWSFLDRARGAGPSCILVLRPRLV
jgi:hypothetical protein